MPASNPYSHAKKGRVKIAETNYFYRSGWEANIAAYLEFLKEQNVLYEDIVRVKF